MAVDGRLVAGKVEFAGFRPTGLLIEDVFGEVDQDRAWASRGSDVKGLVDDVGDIVWISHEIVVLGGGHGDAGRCRAFLEGIVCHRESGPCRRPSTTTSSPIPDDIPARIHEAFHIASTGRPGPVLVDLPKDILNQTLTWKDPKALNLPGYKPTVDGHPRRIKEAVELIAHAKRPVLYVGGGVIKANGPRSCEGWPS